MSPTPFGHDMLRFFNFSKDYINLNNGSFGSLPGPVSKFCTELGASIESNPDKYHRIEFPSLLNEARRRVSEFIGAHVDECVFVSSTTAGINTILRNIDWRADDTIIKFSTTYQGVARVPQYICDINPSVQLCAVELEFPMSHDTIIERFKESVRAVKRTCKKPRIFALIDSLASHPGVYLPWKEMVEVCREEGVVSIIDAAHSIGQEVDINLSSVQPDFWVSNCHKWMFAKRGCTVLYVPKRNQYLIKSALVTSWDYTSPAVDSCGHVDTGFVIQHEWPGAIDFAPYLSVSAALDFRRSIGGEKAINDYCHGLALKGGRRLAEILGTKLMDESPNAELTLNMVNVQLPVSPTADAARLDELLEHRLLSDYNVSVVHFKHGAHWWVSDFEYLGNAILDLLQEA
ncbi:hypothetical protein ONZ45_g5566 [Pleurotus djamor]|nr:hypothetical protein ONZ45_g5566 [Pleurotus djamor]